MLILSRKKDERIIINDEIKIQIVDVKADTVKVGIEAPSHIKVYREEVWSSIQSENKAASETIKGRDESLLQVNEEFGKRIRIKNASSRSATGVQDSAGSEGSGENLGVNSEGTSGASSGSSNEDADK